MYIEQALQTVLSEDATVSGYVDDRIFYVKAPPKAKAPYIVFAKLSAPRDMTLTGASGLVRGRFEFECYSATYMQAKEISQAVKSVLADYSGDMANPAFPYTFPVEFGVPVNGCEVDDELDDWDETAELYLVQMDFLMWYTEN